MKKSAEEFNDQERKSLWRKQVVMQVQDEKQRLEMYQYDLNPYRSQVIEEVVQHIEKMTGFGKDTIDSFAIYIRGLK